MFHNIFVYCIGLKLFSMQEAQTEAIPSTSQAACVEGSEASTSLLEQTPPVIDLSSLSPSDGYNQRFLSSCSILNLSFLTQGKNVKLYTNYIRIRQMNLEPPCMDVSLELGSPDK